MDELTDKEREEISKFIGEMNYYETMNILSRAYGPCLKSELEEHRHILTKAWLKIKRSVDG